MKTPRDPSPKALRGFTLIELLVVISIIGILAGMILPVLARAKVKARVAQAKVEMSSIRTAISQYEADYNRYPASENARNSLNEARCPDFTFGTSYRASGQPFRLTDGTGRRTLPAVDNAGQTFAYQTSNAEAMAALCDILVFRNNEETPNRQRAGNTIVDHVLNPRKQRYLDVKEVDSPKRRGAPASGGLGYDGVYRDPFGNPYLITVDMNFDGRCRDAFYRKATVSRDASTGKGINGLSLPATVNGGDFYEANAPIMVWSLGPDGSADETVTANVGANKDNIISWQ